MKKKTEIDYLNFEDLNEIEKEIETKTNLLKTQITIPEFKRKNWVVNELPYIQEISRIEKAIDTLGEYTGKKKKWIQSRIWVDNIFPYLLETFDYKDYNRWVNNLSLIDTNVKDRTLKGIIIRFFSKIKRMISYLKVNGFTRQEKTEGYNLCGASKDYEITKSNVTLKVEGDVYTLNGTTNNNEYIDFDVLEPIMLDSKTQYTIKTFYLSGNSNKQAYIWLHNSVNKQGIISQFFGNENSIRINDAQELNLNENYIRIKPNAVLNNYKFKILCYKGKIDKPYEPYTGGTASPNPDYPQEIEVGKGKNLFDKDKIIPRFVFPDGTIEDKDSDYWRLSDFIKVSNGIDYNFSWESPDTDFFQVNFNLYDKDKKWIEKIQFQESGTNKTIKFTNASYVRINYSVIVGAKPVNRNKIQFVVGDKPTPYEPYNTIEVKSTGKNLINEANFIIGKVPSISNGQLVSTSGNCTDLIEIDNTKEYNFSGTSDINSLYIFLYDENKNYISNFLTASFANGYNVNRLSDFKKAKYIRIRIDQPNGTKDLMLEPNKDKTSYEPYRESKVQYALQDNFLADKDYIINGKLFKNTAELILTGDENWGMNTTGIYKRFLINPENIKAYTDFNRHNGNLYSNYFIASINDDFGILYQYKDQLLFYGAKDITTLEQWKQWLKDKYNSGNPVKVLYETATTTEIPLKTTGELTIMQGDNTIKNSIDTENTIVYEEM